MTPVSPLYKEVAMEPGLGGQEKPSDRVLQPECPVVAMEPGLGGQEKKSLASP